MKAFLFLPLALLAAPSFASAKPPTPRITEAVARSTALAMVKGGTVKAGELETENRRLIYSFDIAQAGRTGIEEIQISALTGKLVSRHHESPAKEAVEAAADAHAGVKPR